MQWIRSHLSFANVISLIALFAALGGSAYAAGLAKNSVGAKQIKKNAVRAAEIKRNAVRASEIRSNAVAGGEVADGSLGSLDLGDNSVGNAELDDNAVGGAEVADDSLNAADIDGVSLVREIAADVYVRVQPNGTILPRIGTTFPETSWGIAQTNISHPSTGVYCFSGLPINVASAMVSSDNAGAATPVANDVLASVAVERGNGLGGCPATPKAQARVVTTDVGLSPAAMADKGFILWLEDEQPR
jgi:hypothetical protein